MQWLAIFFLSIFACIAYGIIQDQITARICIEYFTIGHPKIILSNDPTVLGLVWGIAATWWVGLILGVPLATIARIGSRSKMTVSLLIRPVAVLFGCNALLATLAGFFGYIAASNGWVWLVGPIVESVPHDKHILFLVDIWVHSASYLGGFLGGIILIIWVWRSRGRATPKGFQERDRGQVV